MHAIKINYVVPKENYTIIINLENRNIKENSSITLFINK